MVTPLLLKPQLLGSLLAVGKPDPRTPSLLGFKHSRNLVKAWIYLKESMYLQK